jgi:hypothetical protein
MRNRLLDRLALSAGGLLFLACSNSQGSDTGDAASNCD